MMWNSFKLRKFAIIFGYYLTSLGSTYAKITHKKVTQSNQFLLNAECAVLSNLQFKSNLLTN